jgi:N4-gp56 family major capsid protein
MADAYTTFAAMANDAPNVYIAAKMIELLQRILVLQKIAEPYPLEQKMSKTLRVVQVSRISLPNAQLVEGVTPATTSLALVNVDVTVEQWGIVCTLTDVVELTVKHPMLNIASERVAMAMKEAAEREDAGVLMAATNVTYPGTVTTRSGLASTDVFNTALAITINAKLEMRGAPKYNPDGIYMGIFQPPHKAAVLGSDATFQQASNFSRVAKLEYGYVGPWMGIDWILGNFLPVFVGVAAPTTAAATATKAQYTVGLNGTLTTANYQIKVVAREITTDYERRLSVQSGNIAVTSPGSIAVKFPTSANYVYDLYATIAGGTTAYLVASRQAASSTYTITADPAGTEATAPVSPTSGVSVYPGFVVGKGAFGTCILNGMSLQTFITPKGPSDSDPLSQRRKVGAKYMRKSFILDNNFIERFETSSGISATIPA